MSRAPVVGAKPKERLLCCSNNFGDVATLSYEPLAPATIENTVTSSKAGAVVSFVGYTRDEFQGKQVVHLEYEAYVPLALKTMLSILNEARDIDALTVRDHACHHLTHTQAAETVTETGRDNKVDVMRMAIHHFLGVSAPLTPSIVICVSAPHRKEAFMVCEWLLERVKERVQIWKREWYGDGTDFVGRDGEVEIGASQRLRTGESVWKENFPPPKSVQDE